MLNINLRKMALLIGVLSSAGLLSSAAMASGSYSFAGNNSASSYNQGKHVYFRKVICDTCPMSAKSSKSTAEGVMKKLGHDSSLNGTLNKTEQESVVKYLSKRYRISL